MEKIKYTEEEIKEIINLSSHIGLLVIFSCKLSYEKKIAFDHIDLFKEIYISEKSEYDNSSYCYGFFVAFACFNVLNFTKNKGIINIIYFNSFLQKEIDIAIKKIKDENSELAEVVKRIEGYFN